LIDEGCFGVGFASLHKNLLDFLSKAFVDNGFAARFGDDDCS
jgi:hypothetical protein